MSAIFAVALVGPKNSPLFFQTFGDVVVLNLQFVVHAALDVLDEKIQDENREDRRKDDNFLGLLQTTDRFKVWGYISSTFHKILIVAAESVHQADIKVMMTKIHALYVDAYSNPFHPIGRPIHAATMTKEVEALATAVVLPMRAV
ncbi:Sedlin [Carpediemonas membranifera]|uniref:Sedlin n=1 Tax=Carpediemonas membranifera TaxID=201153 RepID=A0A8J6AV43_9EUKA|nr:Sedlin [Carpediemonas membranifera]|eukprot:KAG9395536.1 Sedlin [Carpediemonas membranifera]